MRGDELKGTRMKTFFKWIAILLGAIVLALAAFFIGMRYHDGPIEIISGGPFITGELALTPDSWGLIKERDTIEFQTLSPATSRTVWLAVHDGRLFIVSGYMTTGYGKIWKQWPHYVQEDNRVILRIDGKLYEQRLERILDGPEVLPVLKELGRKYGFEAASTDMVSQGYTWMYEVLPRT
ncbi:MAG: hypothetical protein WD994_00055 [Pseudomonadales bacterium]